MNIKYALHSLILIIIFQCSSKSSTAQNLSSISVNGIDSTNINNFTNIKGANLTLDINDTKSILFIASFNTEMSSPSSNFREAQFRIVDNSNPENINSGIISRSLSNSKGTDHGIGSLVYIFNTDGFSGQKTYSFQHAFNSNSRYLKTNVNLTAITLKSANQQLPNDIKRVSIPVIMDTVWKEVTGSQTNVITTQINGGFYVAASIESKTSNFLNKSLAEWKLQYKKENNGTWTDFGNTIERSMSNASDIGIISLLGILPDYSEDGNYFFRIVHRSKTPSSTVYTQSANIVAIALNNGTSYFPIIYKTLNECTTTSSNLTDVVSIDYTPEQNSNIFLHSQFSMQANAETNAPIYDIYINNGILDGPDYKRYLSSSSAIGSGVYITEANNLQQNIPYKISLRHASASGNILTTKNISLIGFSLSPTNSNPLPIKLLSFNTQCAKDSGVIVKWATSSETNNNFFTLLRSHDGVNWESIAEITGAGNSNQVLYYEFKDTEPTLHDTYYKLKQTDFDGKSEEFDIVTIYCKYNHKKITLTPNPANNYVNFSFYNEHHITKPLFVNLYDKTGKLCFTTEFYSNSENNYYSIDIPPHIKPGLYFFHALLGNDYFHTDQLIINK